MFLMYGMHWSGTLGQAELQPGCGLKVKLGNWAQAVDKCFQFDCYQALQVFLILQGGAGIVWGRPEIRLVTNPMGTVVTWYDSVCRRSHEPSHEHTG